MKYLTSNFIFATIPPNQKLDIMGIKQGEALKELRDHGEPCFIPIVQDRKIADKISTLLNYHDASKSYEPEMIHTVNSFPTLTEIDTGIVAIEAREGDETESGLLWYRVKL